MPSNGHTADLFYFYFIGKFDIKKFSDLKMLIVLRTVPVASTAEAVFLKAV